MGDVAIISDIHGNLQALQAVLADIEEQGITERICLGDVVGYGASPSECIKAVRDHGFTCIQGNHDSMVCGQTDLEDISDPTKQSILWTRDQLNDTEKKWLADLPMTLQGKDFEAVHACLHNPEDWPYVLMQDMADLNFSHQSKTICFIGHTHSPAMWVEGEGRIITTSIESLRTDGAHLVNVGSVGQPRDKDERACYAIYRRDQKDIWWRRISYDIAGAQKAITDSGLPSWFAARLSLGK